MRHHQRGFTLIEIAIVLVIIGLLLGGVLKGQELIQSAKVKNMVNDFRTVSTFVYAYQDRFRRLPGDDPAAIANVGASVVASTPANSIGNGRINGAWNSTTATDESYLFWEQVRRANLATGNPVPAGDGYLYTNADGGRVGITGDPVIEDNTWPGAFFVCSAGIQGRVARQIDVTMDDGNTTLGSVRVIC
jgi:prepilin-type N-terminal cleavage/methylation domain-containing protein